MDIARVASQSLALDIVLDYACKLNYDWHLIKIDLACKQTQKRYRWKINDMRLR